MTDFQTAIVPLFNVATDGEEHSLRDAIEELADHYDMSEKNARSCRVASALTATVPGRRGTQQVK